MSAENEIRIVGKYSYTLWPKPGTMLSSESYRICKYTYEEGGKGEFVAAGNNLCEIKEVSVTMYGDWVVKKGNKTFQVTSWSMGTPTTEKGITMFLCSLKCGIGKSRAKAIYDAFGPDTWYVLENTPQRLSEVGLSQLVIADLQTALLTHQTHGKVMELLRGTNIAFSLVDRLVEQFGENAVDVIQNHPYQACRVDGFSFRLMDAIHLQRGGDPTDMERMEAAVVDVLDSMATEGHVCFPRYAPPDAPENGLVDKMYRLLNANLPHTPVSIAMCDEAITAAIADRLVATSIGFVYTIERYGEECRIVAELERLLSATDDCQYTIDILDKAILSYEQEYGITLADSQKEAVRVSMRSPVCILTGGPGTGKTTTTKAILYVHKLLHVEDHSKPVLLSPTGKAARRMSESTGYEASTMHSALGLGAKGYNQLVAEDEIQFLDGNIVLVDEASMADQYVTCELLRAVRTGSKLIFVGDPDQLPSVGCGNILYELIRSKVIPTVSLSVIFRQAGDNPIVENASRTREGNPKLFYNGTSFTLQERTDPEAAFEQAVRMYLASVQKYGIDSTVLLCPYRTASALSVNRFNVFLQNQVNPHRENELTMRGRTLKIATGTNVYLEFRNGDRVMQTKNTNAARNGDIGVIKRICMTTDGPKAYVDWNDSGTEVEMSAEEVKNLDLAYCTTIHKSQGSEYRNVIMVISSAHQRMLKRNLFYTGITRAKENVLLVGESTAVTAAILDNRMVARYTLLGDRLHHMKKKQMQTRETVKQLIADQRKAI